MKRSSSFENERTLYTYHERSSLVEDKTSILKTQMDDEVLLEPPTNRRVLIQHRKGTTKSEFDDETTLQQGKKENRLIHIKFQYARSSHRDRSPQRKEISHFIETNTQVHRNKRSYLAMHNSKSVFRVSENQTRRSFCYNDDDRHCIKLQNSNRRKTHDPQGLVKIVQIRRRPSKLIRSASLNVKHLDLYNHTQQSRASASEYLAAPETHSETDESNDADDPPSLRTEQMSTFPAVTKMYPCTRCSFRANDEHTLQSHMNEHRELIEYHCPCCSYSTKDPESFKVHENLHGRSNVRVNPSVVTKSEAEVPVVKKFLNESKKLPEKSTKKIRGRPRTVTDIPIHTCSYCPYQSRLKHHVKRHELTHLSEKLLNCNICDYGTNNVQSFERHKRQHLSIKYLKCSSCDYETNIKEDLKRHELRHSDNKLFNCQECEYSTNRKFLLQQHRLDHMNIKLFKCALCEYGTNLKSNLVKHEKIHLENKVFQCDLCSYETNRKDHLKKHQKMHGL